jgi:uncharacterized protein YraI
MRRAVLSIFVFLVAGAMFLATAPAQAQIPTVAIPTVTGTAWGAVVTVLGDGQADQLNVRAGPGTIEYEIVGVLVVGTDVPGLGRTAGGEWVQIAYPAVESGVAWVYAPYVSIKGSLPIVAPPPTATPRVTPTIDPTFAAQFLVELAPTRLPTFTPPPPLVIPTYPADTQSTAGGRIPMGLLIVGMATLGISGMLISFLRGR